MATVKGLNIKIGSKIIEIGNSRLTELVTKNIEELIKEKKLKELEVPCIDQDMTIRLLDLYINEGIIELTMENIYQALILGIVFKRFKAEAYQFIVKNNLNIRNSLEKNIYANTSTKQGINEHIYILRFYMQNQ